MQAERLAREQSEAVQEKLWNSYSAALLRTRFEQLAYRVALERKLVTEKIRNEYAVRICLAPAEANKLTAECREETQQVLLLLSKSALRIYDREASEARRKANRPDAAHRLKAPLLLAFSIAAPGVHRRSLRDGSRRSAECR